MFIGHAPRERVSWNSALPNRTPNYLRHAPRERVSWNWITCQFDEVIMKVTLHVSVWVEIVNQLANVIINVVTLHVSVWVEIVKDSSNNTCLRSRSTWACELKCKNHALRTYPQNVTLHVSVWVEI